MKILFANPPTYKGRGNFNRPVRFPGYSYATPVLHPPLLLLYAATYLRSKGHEVDLIDAQVDSLTVESFLSRVEGSSPDYVIIETSTPSFRNDVSVAKAIKDKVNCRTVFVGPHISALPMDSMMETCLDAVIVGEYELSLAEYIESDGDGTQGICYRNKNGKSVLNPPREYMQDLDQLPFPARDLIPNYKYFDPILKNPFTFVLGGRGCPYRCTFCNWPQVMTGRRYRHRTPKNIIDELELIQKEYSFKSFLFNDDTFTADKKHAITVCDEMVQRGIKLPWACYARADETNRDMLVKLREAGCFLLKVGVESGDQNILDNANKKYRISEVVRGIGLMKALGFHVHATFVFGLLGETLETINRTIEFALRLCPTTVQFSTAVPFPGTELHQYLKEQGYLLTENWEEYMPMQPIFEYPALSWKKMESAVKKAYRKYYLRPAYIKTGFKQLFTEPRTVVSNVGKLVKLSL